MRRFFHRRANAQESVETTLTLWNTPWASSRSIAVKVLLRRQRLQIVCTDTTRIAMREVRNFLKFIGNWCALDFCSVGAMLGTWKLTNCSSVYWWEKRSPHTTIWNAWFYWSKLYKTIWCEWTPIGSLAVTSNLFVAVAEYILYSVTKSRLFVNISNRSKRRTHDFGRKENFLH